MGAILNWSTGTFKPNEPDEALAWAERMGWRTVELSPHHARILHRRSSSQGGMPRLPGTVRVASVHAWTTVEGLAEVCPFAHRVGAGVVVVHCKHEQLVGDFAGQVEPLRRWARWCAERGVTLSVENSSHQPLEPFLRLFDAVPEVGFTLDVKHAYKPERLGLTYEDYFEVLADRIVNLHVSGVDRSRDELGDGTPPGRDHIDWSGLCGRLLERRYRGLITVELIVNWDLPASRLASAYADLPAPPGVENPTVPQRLSHYGMEYFRGRFAPLLT